MRSYNPSCLSLARQCEICYKIRYIDNVRPTEVIGDLQFGQAIHLGLQTMLSGESGADLDFENYWNLQKEATFGRYDWDQLRDQGLRMLDKFERFYLKRFKLFKQEERLESKVGEFTVHGTPDFIGELDGIPSIVDFKTSGYNYHKELAITSEQMLFYNHLARIKYSYKAEQNVYLPFIKGDGASIQKPVIAPVTSEILQKCMDNYYRQIKSLDRKEQEGTWVMNYTHAIQNGKKNPCFDYWFKQ